MSKFAETIFCRWEKGVAGRKFFMTGESLEEAVAGLFVGESAIVARYKLAGQVKVGVKAKILEEKVK